MAYGLYIHKQLGDIRLEIHRKDWSGTYAEIKKTGASPLSLIGLDNSGRDVLQPIIKSSLNVSFFDNNEIDTEELFTADATKYKVLLYSDSVLYWGGYLTPDSYSDKLENRTVITLIARDNLGYLDQLDFDMSVDFATSAQVLIEAQKRINWVMSPIEWREQQLVSSDGTHVRDAYINTLIFSGKTWFEAIEMIMRACGSQLRFIGGGFAAIGVADLHGLGNGLQEVDLTHALGGALSQEIIPSWRTLEVRQDAGFIKEIPHKLPDGYRVRGQIDSYLWIGTSGQSGVKISTNIYEAEGNKWSGIRDNNFPLYVLDPEEYHKPTNGLYVIGRNTKGCIVRKFITSQSDRSVEFSINVNNFLWQHTRQVVDKVPVSELRPVYTFTNYVAFKMRCRVLLFGENGTTYQLTENGFRSISETSEYFIEFEVRGDISSGGIKPGSFNDIAIANSKNSDFKIIVPNIPITGSIGFAIYQHNSGVALENYALRFNSITLINQDDDKGNGNKTFMGVFNPQGNIKESIDIAIGEVDSQQGSYLAYAGGIFDNSEYRKSLNGWHRTDGKGDAMPLSELIGRGYAHHFSAFKSASGERIGGRTLMGRIKCKDLSIFSKRIVVRGERYVLNSATLKLHEDDADITLRQVVPYEHAGVDFSVVDYLTGGGSGGIGGVGSGSSSGGGFVDISSKLDRSIWDAEFEVMDEYLRAKKTMVFSSDVVVESFEAGGGGGADLPVGVVGDLLYHDGAAWVAKASATLGFATESWVTARGFATTQWVSSQNFATESWVTARGFATESWVAAQVFATQSWVSSRGYLTAITKQQVLGVMSGSGDASKYLAGNGTFYTIGYSELSGKPDLSVYATTSWVSGNYLAQSGGTMTGAINMNRKPIVGVDYLTIDGNKLNGDAQNPANRALVFKGIFSDDNVGYAQIVMPETSGTQAVGSLLFKIRPYGSSTIQNYPLQDYVTLSGLYGQIFMHKPAVFEQAAIFKSQVTVQNF